MQFGIAGGFLLQPDAFVAEADDDDAFVVLAAFAADIAGGFQAFQQRGQRARFQEELFAEAADGLAVLSCQSETIARYCG